MSNLVHPDAAQDPAEKNRHERFIISRLITGFAGLAALPLYLVFRHAPSFLEVAAFCWLLVPLIAAFTLSRTGRLDVAHTISALGFAGLVTMIAAATGGAASPAAVLIVAVPVEAMLSGSRRAVYGAGLASVGAAMALGLMDVLGLIVQNSLWPSALSLPLFVVAGVLHAVALALTAHQRSSQRWMGQSGVHARDRIAIESIDDLVTWHDTNGAVLFASTAAFKLLGASPSSLQDRGLFDRVHVPDRPAYLKAITDAVFSQSPVCVQFRIRKNVGGSNETEMVWVEMRARHVPSIMSADKGSSYAVVAVTRDISAAKHHEAELEDAKAAAEKADASKGRFLATVSHELRTPLNAIIGFSEILAGDVLGPDEHDRRREYAKIIHMSGHHLLEVVNALLDMSKIETGNFDFIAEPMHPATLVANCYDLMRLKAEREGLLLVRDIQDNLPEIVADSRACKQILINLISNAIKFTPQGGRIVIAAERRGERLSLSVSDTGIGISEDDLPRLGSPFFQARSSYNRSHEGTGLGLSVVRGLVTLHKGTMSIESSPGEGTTVTVMLPLDCRMGTSKPANPIRIETALRRRNHFEQPVPMVRKSA